MKKQRFYLRDPRQQSVINGKPEGGWLKTPPAPAVWVTRRAQAATFTLEEIYSLKRLEPYLRGCEIVPVDSIDPESL